MHLLISNLGTVESGYVFKLRITPKKISLFVRKDVLIYVEEEEKNTASKKNL
jgi:hypothetical protein